MIKRKISKFILAPLVIGGTFLFQSCNNNAMYDQTYSFDDQVWNVEDTATFEVAVTDTISHYNFILTLRNTTSYLYSNLWVFISVTSPDSSVSKVAEKLPLAYPDGTWRGTVSGSLVETKIPFSSKRFPIKGNYIFKISNATQQGKVGNIEDIGLRIIKVKRK